MDAESLLSEYEREVIRVLMRRGGRSTVNSLAWSLGISRQRLVPIGRSLVKGGYLRYASLTPGEVMYEVTDAGEREMT